MANKNYYEILGVSKDASQEDIKKAYKKMAKEHHPDMVDDNDKTQAERRFKEINEAYQVLSDPQKRKMFDQFGTVNAGFGPQGGGARRGFNQSGPFTYTYTTSGDSPFGDIDPFDIFEEFFGFRGYGRGRRPRKGKNLYYEMRIDFEDAVHGTEKEINIESGKIKVKIPQGVRNGTEIKFVGKGMPGPKGASPGDLYINFNVPTPQEFQRVGDNLGTTVEIDFIQAALGDTVKVPVIDLDKKSGIGKSKLKIPQGTQPRTQFRLRGKGIPRLNGNGRGDVIVEVFVKIPKRLSRKQRRLLQEYRDL